jgi:hypothetical protein
VADHRGIDDDTGLLKTRPAVRQRKPCLIHRLLSAEQEPIPTHCAVGRGQFGEFNQLLVQGDGASDIWWQRLVWLSVDPDGEHLALVGDRGGPVTGAVSQTAHHTWWPYRLPVLAGQYRRWR